MPKRKYAVRLTEKEREELRSIVSKGKSASRTIKRAHVLLRLDSNADAKCAIDELDRVLGISRTTVNNILKDYQRRGIECIWRKKRDTPPVTSYRRMVCQRTLHLIQIPIGSLQEAFWQNRQRMDYGTRLGGYPLLPQANRLQYQENL